MCDPFTLACITAGIGAAVNSQVPPPPEAIVQLQQVVADAQPQISQAIAAAPPEVFDVGVVAIEEWLPPADAVPTEVIAATQSVVAQLPPEAQVAVPEAFRPAPATTAPAVRNESYVPPGGVATSPQAVSPVYGPPLGPKSSNDNGTGSVGTIGTGAAPTGSVQFDARAVVFDPSQPRDQDLARRVVELALSQVGVPYQWAGGNLAGPTLGDGRGGPIPGFDCSALMRWAYSQATNGRVVLPRTSQVQFTVGQQISIANAQPGDLLFGNWQADGANHVAMYLGNGLMVEAPDVGLQIRVSAVRSDMFATRIF